MTTVVRKIDIYVAELQSSNEIKEIQLDELIIERELIQSKL